MEKNNVQQSWQRTKNNLMKSQPDQSKEKISIKKDGDDSFIDINTHLSDKMQEQWSTENECKREFTRVSIGEGYVNPAFVGSTDELASLEFDCSARKHSKQCIFRKNYLLFLIDILFEFLFISLRENFF